MTLFGGINEGDFCSETQFTVFNSAGPTWFEAGRHDTLLKYTGHHTRVTEGFVYTLGSRKTEWPDP